MSRLSELESTSNSTSIDELRFKNNGLEKRVAYLEGVVETLIARLDAGFDVVNARLAELENDFDQYVDDELIEKLDFPR